MGVTLESKKGEISLDMGYMGFRRLREKVAELCNHDFSELYAALLKVSCSSNWEEHFEKLNAEIDKLIERKAVNPKVADFCLQPDCEGKIHYGACKEIYKHIKDVSNEYSITF